MKNNKIPYIIITILLIIIAVGITYIVTGKKNNKESENNNTQEAQENNQQNESDIYGYTVIVSGKDRTASKIVELHKSGKNNILAEYSDRIYSFTKKHNMLYYLIQIEGKKNDTTITKSYYIDLNDPKLEPVELSSGIEVGYYFDFNDEYLFYTDYQKGLKRYNRNTKKEEIIYKDKGVFELFIVDEKLYIMSYSSSQNEEYYTIDFNGENLKSINKDEYDKAAKSIDYIDTTPNYEDQYLIYNNNKVSLADEQTKLMYNGEEIYSTKNNRKIMLIYSLNQDEIAFIEHAGELELIEEEYYIYNLKTNSLTKTTSNNVYEFEVIYNN